MGPATSSNILVLINIKWFKGEKGKTIDRIEGLYSAFIQRLSYSGPYSKKRLHIKNPSFSILVLYYSDYDRKDAQSQQ